MQLARTTSASPDASSPLASILRPDLNLVTFARRLLPEVAAALRVVAASTTFVREAQLDTGSPAIWPLLEHVADPLARSFLAADIAALASDFGRVLDRRHVHAKLSVVHDDGCRKLHTDNVTVRLLCTYAGPGTEWVPDADVVRENLGRVDVDVDTANRSVLRRPGVVRVCEEGDVILLKGEAYRGNRGRGAVHRSPPIRARGLRRLLLKIDEHPCGC